MSDSTRYFQLTPNILVEYNYNNLSSINDMAGEAKHIIDLGNDACVISNGYCATRTLLIDKYEDRFVQPINKSESKFIQCVKKLEYSNGHTYIWDWNTDFGCDYKFTSEGNEDYDDDILIDTFRLHFTSRNYLGDYDGFILTVYLYDRVKNKVGLLSYYMKKTDDPDINQNPVLINQKLYTTYKDFTIPNVSAIIHADELQDTVPAEQLLRNKLFPENKSLMENSPVVMTIYGVKATYENNNHEYYNVEKLNSIFIPLEDNSNQLYIQVQEADDGDYFKIYPEVDGGKVSFSDYIYKISDGAPERYIVFHEVLLNEYVEGEDKPITTHREQYIINSVDVDGDVNEKDLDKVMYYRPVVVNGSKLVSFDIDVNTYIINTLDNTTLVKSGELRYSPENGFSPKKYGKKMNRIYLGDIPAQINVYNRKPDIDRDGVKITGSNSNVKIENHQHSVIGFIECVNVGVSIEQVPKEELQ